jgi:hypothetical protein
MIKTMVINLMMKILLEDITRLGIKVIFMAI